jgi:hypothetical protein
MGRDIVLPPNFAAIAAFISHYGEIPSNATINFTLALRSPFAKFLSILFTTQDFSLHKRF